MNDIMMVQHQDRQVHSVTVAVGGDILPRRNRGTCGTEYQIHSASLDTEGGKKPLPRRSKSPRGLRPKQQVAVDNLLSSGDEAESGEGAGAPAPCKAPGAATDEPLETEANASEADASNHSLAGERHAASGGEAEAEVEPEAEADAKTENNGIANRVKLNDDGKADEDDGAINDDTSNHNDANSRDDGSNDEQTNDDDETTENEESKKKKKAALRAQIEKNVERALALRSAREAHARRTYIESKGDLLDETMYVHAIYKRLRREEGLSPGDAMRQARAEFEEEQEGALINTRTEELMKKMNLSKKKAETKVAGAGGGSTSTAGTMAGTAGAIVPHQGSPGKRKAKKKKGKGKGGRGKKKGGGGAGGGGSGTAAPTTMSPVKDDVKAEDEVDDDSKDSKKEADNAVAEEGAENKSVGDDGSEVEQDQGQIASASSGTGSDGGAGDEAPPRNEKEARLRAKREILAEKRRRREKERDPANAVAAMFGLL